MNRIRIKITGESGAGLLSTGEIITRSLRDLGFSVVADREYPSLIKGGHSCFLINAAGKKIRALSGGTDIMLAIDKQSLEAYFDDLKPEGILVHGYERPKGIADIIAKAEERKIKVVHLMAREIAEESGGNYLMSNMVLIGMLWRVLGLDYEIIKKQAEKQFASKPKLLEIDLRCLEAGFERTETVLHMEIAQDGARKNQKKQLLIDGNQALAMGAVHAGVRVYVAYPMSPASSILTHLADWANQTGMVVKQGEDEITVAQMALGSMFMGARTLAATSGGGYDLMTETVSLAGMIENPLVIVLAQRPGPATGLPTWTMQGDLNLALYSSHGEFPRIVIGVSDPTDCFDLMQHAFNLAEKYQTAVILLTEKQIAECKMTVAPFEQGKIEIDRGLIEGEELAKVENRDRYAITENGLSKRWLPGASEKFYFANGDEHFEDGTLTEEANEAEQMYAKRMRKLDLIEQNLPEPEVYGADSGAEISFVGWGSSKNVMMDVIANMEAKGIKVNYLHYSYLFPLRTVSLRRFIKKNLNICLIEGNYLGQFGDFIKQKTGLEFKNKLLKYNGRPFFVEEVEEFINQNL